MRRLPGESPMSELDSPFAAFAAILIAQIMAAYAGALFRRKARPLKDEDRSDFDVLRTAALTLLGLIIGFSFSLAISRYDQRKNLEEAEANAIGTEYIRADFLSPAEAANVRVLLKNYLDQRVLFYGTRDDRHLRQINADTARLQADLWTAVRPATEAKPTPVAALVVSGMNDVLNSQGYTQAAWWNRIPSAAWGLMVVIAICCNLLVGYGAHRAETKSILLLVLPLIVSISFFLIADIDSPRGGVVRVRAQNLTSLSQSLHPR